MAEPANLIRGKVTPPHLPDTVIPRPRVERMLLDATERHTLVWVCATAGAGKTTAVRQAAELGDRELVWLTLDPTESAPGRLVVYLAGALAQVAPGAAQTASHVLAEQIQPPEAAGLVAEAVDGTPILFVIDELERLVGSYEAFATIGALARYAPPSLRLVLVSREELPLDLGPLVRYGATTMIDEAALAFTTAEAAEALSAAGAKQVDSAAAVAATGGWVTGVLFEAWRSDDHVPGMGGEADPLHGYLSSQILAQLTAEETDFLLRTSPLDRITGERAEALGVSGAGELLVTLRRRRLPVAWEPDGAMRAHPRFREYLIACLRRGGERRFRDLRLAHARLLAEEGHDEEAAEEFLRAGCPRMAIAPAERAVERVVERLDFTIAERWINALGDLATPRPRAFTNAELMLAVAAERFRDAAAIAARLEAEDQLDLIVRSSGQVVALLAWASWHLGEIGRARELLASAPPAPEVDLARAMLELLSGQHPRVRVSDVRLGGGPLDALARRIWWACGHFPELSRAVRSEWAAAVTATWRVMYLQSTGRTADAWRLYRAAEGKEPGSIWRRAIVGPMIAGDMGRFEEALEALHRGRELFASCGSVVYELQSLAVEAKLELRSGAAPDAGLEVLDQLHQHPRLHDYPFLAEQADTWLGLSLLRRSCDREARDRLAETVRRMLEANRVLELPTAAAYWSEAAWRIGEEAEADEAAEVARRAAEQQGSYHILLQALDDFPAVISRRLDAQTEEATAWHSLARALAAQTRDVLPTAPLSLYLREFGSSAIFVDGEEVRPRIRKSVELLAYLLYCDRDGAEREELLDVLFAGRTDRSSRAYLRQAIHRLREALPSEGVLVVEGGRVRLEGTAVQSESRRFEDLVREAAKLQGDQRLASLQQALQLADRGEYLHGITTPWVEERRRELEAVSVDARLDAAELAFELGRYQESERLARSALACDRYRERGWRLVMRTAHALADEDRLLGAYRECSRVLAELDLRPAGRTEQLLRDLRRAPLAS